MAIRIAPTCGGPSYVQTVSCISGYQSGSAHQRPREQFCEVGRLVVTLDRSEDQFDRPFSRDTFVLERIGQAQSADDEIRLRRPAAGQLLVDILSFAQTRIGRKHFQFRGKVLAVQVRRTDFHQLHRQLA